MNGFAGSSPPKKQKQGLAGSNGVVLASKTESGGPVVGLAVRIVETIAIWHTIAAVSLSPVYAPQKHPPLPGSWAVRFGSSPDLRSPMQGGPLFP
jgi:hypothetical protein